MRGVSLHALARAVTERGVKFDASRLSLVERGLVAPTAAQLAAIGAALGMDPDSLLRPIDGEGRGR